MQQSSLFCIYGDVSLPADTNNNIIRDNNRNNVCAHYYSCLDSNLFGLSEEQQFQRKTHQEWLVDKAHMLSQIIPASSLLPVSSLFRRARIIQQLYSGSDVTFS